MLIVWQVRNVGRSHSGVCRGLQNSGSPPGPDGQHSPCPRPRGGRLEACLVFRLKCYTWPLQHGSFGRSDFLHAWLSPERAPARPEASSPPFPIQPRGSGSVISTAFYWLQLSRDQPGSKGRGQRPRFSKGRVTKNLQACFKSTVVLSTFVGWTDGRVDAKLLPTYSAPQVPTSFLPAPLSCATMTPAYLRTGQAVQPGGEGTTG